MNVYDFDETIFYPDSLLLFALFVANRHPIIFIKVFPEVIVAIVKYLLDKSNRVLVTVKLQKVFAYLADVDLEIELFWKKYERNISAWYLAQKREDDLVISGSPTCLLEPIIKKLGIKLIATEIDSETGVTIGNVMLAKKKAKYIIDHDMPLIENFYSDSISDTPIALLAERAYLVKNKARTLTPWPHLTKEFYKKVHNEID